MKKFLVLVLALIALSVFLSACASAHRPMEEQPTYFMKEDLCSINHDIAAETDPFFKGHFIIYQFDGFGGDTVTIGTCGADIMTPMPMTKVIDPKNPNKKIDTFDDKRADIVLREMNEYVKGTGHEKIVGTISIKVHHLTSKFEVKVAVSTPSYSIPWYTYTWDNMEFLGDGRYLMNRPPKAPAPKAQTGPTK